MTDTEKIEAIQRTLDFFRSFGIEGALIDRQLTGDLDPDNLPKSPKEVLDKIGSILNG